MKRGLWFFILFLALACGKNDPIRTVGYYPPPGGPDGMPYAPPPGGGYYPPGVPQVPYPYPPYPGGGQCNQCFNPQLPPGYPPQYYPFLPVHIYIVSHPMIWIQWQQIAGSNQYNFPAFWNWCRPQMGPAWDFYNSNIYSWMTPQTQFPPYADPGSFWQNYRGFPLNSCGQYCF